MSEHVPIPEPFSSILDELGQYHSLQSRRVPSAELRSVLRKHSIPDSHTTGLRFELTWQKPTGSRVQRAEPIANLTMVRCCTKNSLFSSRASEIPASVAIQAPAEGYLLHLPDQTWAYGPGVTNEPDSPAPALDPNTHSIGYIALRATLQEIHYLYHTSFLMGDDPEAASKFFPRRISDAVMRQVIPLQVKRELQAHIKDPEKSPKAAQARTFLAGLLADPETIQVDLATQAPEPLLEVELGPDSQVDKQLLYYAIHCAKSGNACFIATEDGGIKMEVMQQWQQKHLPIFCPGNFLEFFDLLRELDRWCRPQPAPSLPSDPAPAPE